MSMSASYNIEPEDVALSSTEVNFISLDEQEYPQLTRLYLDFDFRVFAIGTARGLSDKHYLMTSHPRDRLSGTAISPKFASLRELEKFVNDNIVDILNELLDEEVNLDERVYS